MKKVRRWYATGGVERQKITGEVFTPEHVGLDMLSLLMDHDPGLITGTFLDPSCGDGNLLVCVLKLKIGVGITPHQALESLYGIELMEDNVVRCRQRLVDYAVEHGGDVEHCLATVNRCTGSRYPRIVRADFLTWDVANWHPAGASEFIRIGPDL
jgi:hypothetical protein